MQIYLTHVAHSGGDIDDNADRDKFGREATYFQSEENAFTLRPDIHSGCSVGFVMIDAAGEHATRDILTHRRDAPDDCFSAPSKAAHLCTMTRLAHSLTATTADLNSWLRLGGRWSRRNLGETNASIRYFCASLLGANSLAYSMVNLFSGSFRQANSMPKLAWPMMSSVTCCWKEDT